jgi:hypothetical protein
MPLPARLYGDATHDPHPVRAKTEEPRAASPGRRRPDAPRLRLAGPQSTPRPLRAVRQAPPAGGAARRVDAEPHHGAGDLAHPGRARANVRQAGPGPGQPVGHHAAHVYRGIPQAPGPRETVSDGRGAGGHRGGTRRAGRAVLRRLRPRAVCGRQHRPGLQRPDQGRPARRRQGPPPRHPRHGGVRRLDPEPPGAARRALRAGVPRAAAGPLDRGIRADRPARDGFHRRGVQHAAVRRGVRR